MFLYRRADGQIRRELRHPDDVFDPESIASLTMAPITDDHPEEFVTPENVKELSVGWISDTVEKADTCLAGYAIIADKEAIAKANKGKVELSCGYHADVIDEVGEYNGQKYDSRQKNIRYNHVALVERGRMGPTVRLRMDAEDAVADETEIERNDTMKTIKINGKDVQVSDEAYDAIMAERKAHEDALAAERKAKTDAESEKKKAEEEKKKAEDEAKKAKEDADKVQAKLDQAEQKLAERADADIEKAIEKAANERVAILKVADSILGDEFKAEGKSNLEIMKEVISKASPKTELKDKSDAYVQARFDAIAEEMAGRETRRQDIGRKLTDSRAQEDFDSKAARERAWKADSEAWKKPMSVTKG